MPVFLDGQENLAALTVPGVYGDIILPTPFLLGTPTNIEGLVGVGSWGPLNALISAAVTSGAVTITGKYTGILGNQITFNIVNGTAANSLQAIVSFPGIVPEQFNNVTGPVPATATATFSANVAANDTLTIGGTVVTFVSGTPVGPQVKIGSSLSITLSNLLSFLLTSADTNIIKFNYSVFGSVLTFYANQFTGGGTGAGTGGNALTLSKSSTAIALSGATLSGGTGTWQTFWTNLANVINSGNAFHGPSGFVVATAGTSTTAPTLTSPITLTGGTDGAANVTDATLIGQDIVPRKGMYALRQSNIDCFTLCDLSTPADYAAIASFGLSETALPIFATTSGDTIANCLATRVNSGIDTPWFKLILGDYPTFLDSFNGVSRLINPSAFGLGIYGNLSPQQNALNKPLQGISATQRTQLGQTYSEVELSLINTGGIDVILGPQSSPGGFYFSFATGRNASSNTAAAGDEYTRMTNFLIRTAQSKAAGSFVGQLQSIQPNDQTRANAKALFDGFSQQLASPQFGLGINGQGIIDSPWLVQCDLNNNPPNLQALGYLFLYWTVRYLNVIRYFVIKFQGGGNVTVSVQNTQPSASQFASQVNTTVA